MGCVSSKYVPWAGQNEVTTAAKHRKRAAKDILLSMKAYCSSHYARLSSFRVYGQQLANFLQEEDRALFSGALPAATTQYTPSSQPFVAPWVKNPESLADTGNPEGPTAIPSDPVVTSSSSPNPAVSSQLSSVTYSGHSGVAGPLALIQDMRGFGLSELGRTLAAMFADVESATAAASVILACGNPKNYTGLPPVDDYTQPGVTPGRVWDVLEVLLAYEKARSKELKKMELAKWDYARNSKKLSQQTKREVAADKAQKHQKRIEATHSKVQEVQATIARLGQSVDSHTHTIHLIKSVMLLPALQHTLYVLSQAHLNTVAIFEKQRQLAIEGLDDGKLSGRHVAGEAVLCTSVTHHEDTKALLAAIAKVEQAFSAEAAAERKLLTSIITWLKKIDPTGTIDAPAMAPPQFPAAQSPFPPTQGPFPPSQDSYPPAQGPYPPAQGPYPPAQGQFPPAPNLYPPGQGQHQNPHFEPQPSPPPVPPPGPPPTTDPFLQFLDGQATAAEPLNALCCDWLRAMDRSGMQAAREALLFHSSWVQETLNRQSAELKQLKVVEEAIHQVTKAEKRLDTAIKKEKHAKAALQDPTGPSPESQPYASNFHTEASGEAARQVNEEPQQGTFAGSLHDKAAVRAMAKEQAKEVKACQLERVVTMEKGMAESSRIKLEEERASLFAIALTARVTAIEGAQKAIPPVFGSFGDAARSWSQMYGLLSGGYGQKRFY